MDITRSKFYQNKQQIIGLLVMFGKLELYDLSTVRTVMEPAQQSLESLLGSW